MKFHGFFHLLFIAAIVGCTVSCLSLSPKPAAPTPAAHPQATLPPPAPPSPVPPPAPAAAPNAYFNTKYHFTCTIPDGFIVTHESDGPGEIITMVPQSMSSNSTVDLSVRAAPLGRLTLQQYMEFRITRDLQGAANVAHWDMFPASYGAYSGFEVLVDRQYANGPFKFRLFG